MSKQIDERLTALEIKASFTEDLVDKLEQIVVQQQATIDALRQQTRALAQRLQDDDPGARLSMNQDRPPHY